MTVRERTFIYEYEIGSLISEELKESFEDKTKVHYIFPVGVNGADVWLSPPISKIILHDLSNFPLSRNLLTRELSA